MSATTKHPLVAQAELVAELVSSAWANPEGDDVASAIVEADRLSDMARKACNLIQNNGGIVVPQVKR